MARFKGTMSGNRGQVSRLGTVKSGIMARVNGWNCGVLIDGFVDEEDHDTFRIYASSGSNNFGPTQEIGTVTSTLDGFKFIPA